MKHLAEWAGYNHGVAKKQAIEMFTGFVADIGRVLKKGSKIRIPNLGVLYTHCWSNRAMETRRSFRLHPGARAVCGSTSGIIGWSANTWVSRRLPLGSV